MPPIGPVSRRDFIAYLRQLNFTGPFPGSSHDYMERGTQRIRIPNPHQGDISRDLLVRMLRQVGISRQEWEVL